MKTLSRAIFGMLLACVSAQVLGADYTGGVHNSGENHENHKATQVAPAENANNDLIVGLEKLIALKKDVGAIAQLNMNMSQGGMPPDRYNLKATYRKYDVESALNTIYREIETIEKALREGKQQ